LHATRRAGTRNTPRREAHYATPRDPEPPRHRVERGVRRACTITARNVAQWRVAGHRGLGCATRRVRAFASPGSPPIPCAGRSSHNSNSRQLFVQKNISTCRTAICRASREMTWATRHFATPCAKPVPKRPDFRPFRTVYAAARGGASAFAIISQPRRRNRCQRGRRGCEGVQLPHVSHPRRRNGHQRAWRRCEGVQFAHVSHRPVLGRCDAD